jgi:hypothetical protein
MSAQMAGFGGRTRTSGQGRPKGVPNRVTREREEQIAASGLAPLAYMLSVLRDDKNPQAVRMEAARAAAPYCHPRLASVEYAVEKPRSPAETIDFASFSREDRQVLRRAAELLVERQKATEDQQE